MKALLFNESFICAGFDWLEDETRLVLYAFYEQNLNKRI